MLRDKIKKKKLQQASKAKQLAIKIIRTKLKT
jgi:hypothetical protein